MNSKRHYRYTVPIFVLCLSLFTMMSLFSAPPARAADDWLFMVYIDGDNNLEEDAIDDFLEMASGAEANPSVNVHVVVQLDRIPGYDSRYGDWTGTKRFKVYKGSTPVDSDPGFSGDVGPGGEADMGNPQTLVDFVQWARGDYPSVSRQALVLWDHGSGWKRSAAEQVVKGVCWDETNSDNHLSQADQRNALDTLTAGGTDKLDFIGFDACLMGMIEVDCDIKPYCEARASCGKTEPGEGWPYDTVLGDLVANPGWNENQLASDIVDRYFQSYDDDEVLSAVDFSAGYDELVTAVDSFGAYMRDHVDELHRDVYNAASEALRLYYDYIDLYGFAEQIRELTSDTALRGLAQDVMDGITAVVINEKHGPDYDGAHGVTVYFPVSMGRYLNSYRGSSGLLLFTQQTCWDDFLWDSLKGDSRNLASSIQGAKVMDFSQELGGWWVANNLIDCGFTGWKSVDSIAGNYLTVRLAGEGPYELGAIVVDPGPPIDPVSIDEGPEEGLKQFHVEVSTDGLNYQTVCSGSFGIDDLRQLNVFDVSAQKKLARYVRIVTDAAQDPSEGKVSIGELEVYPASPSPDTWYLAEGTTAWGFNTYLTVENPNDDQVQVKLTYMDTGAAAGAGAGRGGEAGQGRIATRTVTLPPLSQTTVDPRWDLGDTDFSTKVECLQGKPIAVDRTMYWTGAGAPCAEGHNSIGVNAPSSTWYLPEGSSDHGFETWTCVQNPNAHEASVTLTYMVEDDGARIVERTIPAGSRASYSMAEDIGAHDASVRVSSDFPVIAERSMYRNDRREGSCSIGAVCPAADYYLAEGTTGYGFTTYVLVQNPNDSAADVTVTYMTPGGAAAQDSFHMRANTRKTIRINDVEWMGDTDFSTHVHASLPVVAERAMYWNGGPDRAEACHASIGLPSAHMEFWLPDGQTSSGWETWTCVQNPNTAAVTVEVTYLQQGGGEKVSFTDVIPKNSRRTYNMAGQPGVYPGIDGRASVVVRSLDDARPVIVERAMYAHGRGLGTNTIGGYSD